MLARIGTRRGRREGAQRIRNFPRISRINGKCQIFRGVAASAPYRRLHLLYFIASLLKGKEKRKGRCKITRRKWEYAFGIPWE